MTQSRAAKKQPAHKKAAGSAAKHALKPAVKPALKPAPKATSKAAPKPTPKRRVVATEADTRLFDGYRPIDGSYDEFFDAAGKVRPRLKAVTGRLDAVGHRDFQLRQGLANAAFLQGGVTFSVYSDRRGAEKIFPFDLVPRVVPSSEWDQISVGLEQRVAALNAFIADVYGEQRILDEGVVPRALVESCAGYERKVRGIVPPGGVYIHVAGIDLIRGADGEYLVLEDNVRTPSGVSYVLENRNVMKRVFPIVFRESRIRPVGDYPARLRSALRSVAPDNGAAQVVVLTPGPHNSAYFEHGYLARNMGVELVHNDDLFVHKKRVYMKTTRGPVQVNVIYRRVDDEFLDPLAFRKDSLLGVPGLFEAYASGNVTLANAIGNGVADDKSIYPYVHDMIRFYLSEEPLLAQVETLKCNDPADRKRVLSELNKLVVKRVDGSGGYGMLIGPSATKAQLKEFAAKIAAEPRQYIAQPRIELSTCPTWTKGGLAPRRVDIRPYIVSGASRWVLPGGLTRVALTEGSYVVNSSQGGGSKDTWVLEDDNA